MTDTDHTDASGGADDRPLVLVVDDEERVTEAFSLWLESDYRVRTATSGEAALEQLDDEVDVVLLDRHMPGLSGDETLERIRESDVDPMVAMVTGVDPDFGIVDMPFEDYLTKPVGKDELASVVERLLSFGEYDETLRELFSVAQKQATLEAQYSSPELDESDEYAQLSADYERLSEQADAASASLDHDSASRAFENL